VQPTGPTAQPSGWYADPAGRHQSRYWDGVQWTDQVADQGIQAVDPLGPPPAGGSGGPPPRKGPPMALIVGLGALAAVAVFVGLFLVLGRGEDGGSTPSTTEQASDDGGDDGGDSDLDYGTRVEESELSAGEFESVTVELRAGDLLRVKVVPDDPDLDPQLGLAMAEEAYDEDYWNDFPFGTGADFFSGGDVPEDIELLYAIDVNLSGEPEAIWEVAFTDAVYTILVRGWEDTVGSYTLTIETAEAPEPVRDSERDAGNEAYLSVEAWANRTVEAEDFFVDEDFFSDRAMSDDYFGPLQSDLEGFSDLLSDLDSDSVDSDSG
jgi:hypothetical protein